MSNYGRSCEAKGNWCLPAVRGNQWEGVHRNLEIEPGPVLSPRALCLQVTMDDEVGMTPDEVGASVALGCDYS
jgi:hypothetical protein